MTEKQNKKVYDLGKRTKVYAKRVREFVKNIPKTIANVEDARQVIRSSGSVGANYIEAEESLSKKDFNLRIKICRKEAKESKYWLELLNVRNDMIEERDALVQEASELTKIFGAIVQKSK